MVKFSINRMSTNEKLAGLAVLGVAAYFGYQWYEKNHGALPGTTSYTPTSTPLGTPAPTPSAPSASPAIIPANYTTGATQTGSLAFTVTTTDTGDAGRLTVRAGPDVSTAQVGYLEHGSTVASNGVVQNGFTQVVDNNGTTLGWCSLSYLTPLSPLANLA